MSSLPEGLLILLMSATLPRLASAQATRPGGSEMIWHWVAGCAGGDSLSLRVSLDGQPVYSAVLPICHLRHADIRPEPEERILVFHFNAAPKRFRAQNAAAVQGITGSIWESGRQSDAVLLGFSFAIEDQVLLNMTHIARADQPARSERVRGLVIMTSPVRVHR